MSFLRLPWHILLTSLCGMMNQRQQQVIEFQNAQIETLLKKLGKSVVEVVVFARCCRYFLDLGEYK